MTLRSGHGKALLFLVLGIVYGLALAFMGFMLSGVGHGSYLVFFVAGAPVSFLAPIHPLVFWLAVIWPALMWGLVGALLGSSSRFQHRSAVVLTLFHYASVAFGLFLLMVPADEFVSQMFRYDYRSGVISTVIYLSGQLLVWVAWFMRTQLR